MRSSRFAMAAISLMLLGGCKGDDDRSANAQVPANPGSGLPGQAPANVQGVWTGTVNGSAAAGTTDATLTLSQSGNAVSGTFAAPEVSGNISGTVTENTFLFTVTPTSGQPSTCTAQVSGSATIAGDTMTIVLTNRAGQVVRSSVISSTGPVVCPADTVSGQGSFTRRSTSASLSVRP